MQKDYSKLSLEQKFLLPEFEKEKNQFFSSLKRKDLVNLQYNWHFFARPNQLPPDDDSWTICLIRSGRGFGKTKAGAEWVRIEEAKARKRGEKIEIGLVGDIFTDIEDAQVKAIINCYPPDDPNKPEYKKGKLYWPKGSVGHLIQAEVPKKFRSKNLTHAWVDELAKFQYHQKAWEGLLFAVRIGKHPKIFITTTPAIRAKKLLNDIEKHKYGKAIVYRGTSYENQHLSDDYLNIIIKPFEGTRLGKQEIYGADIEEVAGALWNHGLFKYWSQFREEEEEKAKKQGKELTEEWERDYFKNNLLQIIVAVDPATTKNLKSNETGIIVAARNKSGQGFILEDKSGKYSPDGWAKVVVSLYKKWKAKCVVAEKNQGGDMVESVIHHQEKIPVVLVHATKGKTKRAEPVARLYEQGKVYHLNTSFTQLEEQMCSYTGQESDQPDHEVEEFDRIDSPDRMDALVWALSYLFSDQIKPPSKKGITSFRISAY